MHLADPWDPMSLGEIRELFAAAPFRWWVSGGLALELHIGRSWREHGDADVGVLRSDAAAMCDWMGGRQLVVAASGSVARWNGRSLAAGENNVWVRGESSWVLDLTLNDGDDERRIYRRDPSIARPWATAVLSDDEDTPYLAPELQLLFKSRAPRPRDHQDAAEVIPLLGPRDRTFLRSHLPAAHVWHDLLGADAAS